jgi:hypothetical protein
MVWDSMVTKFYNFTVKKISNKEVLYVPYPVPTFWTPMKDFKTPEEPASTSKYR